MLPEPGGASLRIDITIRQDRGKAAAAPALINGALPTVSACKAIVRIWARFPSSNGDTASDYHTPQVQPPIRPLRQLRYISAQI